MEILVCKPEPKPQEIKGALVEWEKTKMGVMYMIDVSDELLDILRNTAQVKALVRMIKEQGYTDELLDKALEQMDEGYDYDELREEQRLAVIDAVEEAMRRLRNWRQPTRH